MQTYQIPCRPAHKPCSLSAAVSGPRERVRAWGGSLPFLGHRETPSFVASGCHVWFRWAEGGRALVPCDSPSWRSSLVTVVCLWPGCLEGRLFHVGGHMMSFKPDDPAKWWEGGRGRCRLPSRKLRPWGCTGP